jgi:ferredoxin
MITGEEKPLEEIQKMLAGVDNLLILGCGTCVTVCLAGGEKEVATLADLLRLKGAPANIAEHTVERQCDEEFFVEAAEKIEAADAVLSMACGAGVQLMAKLYPETPVYPAINTRFIGLVEEQGKWLEVCLACGDCKLGRFGGVCPVTRCSKSLMNGPCGGSAEGKCEVDPESIECGWQLIYDRLEKIGQLENLTEVELPNDYSAAHDGSPRRMDRKDMHL